MILQNFEAISGLKVNFQKCSVLGFNLEEDFLSDVAEIFGCEIGRMPMNYLGLKMDGRLNGEAEWGDVVEKVKKRLREWNAKYLSLGGRVTLINSVLAAIPIHRLSFTPIPAKVAKQLQSLQRDFLWGGDESTRKIPWAYELIDEVKGEKNQFRWNGAQFRRLWKVAAPHKALITAWRLLWNRLPTCDNLAKRINLPLGERGCKCCGMLPETAKHFFLECNQVLKLWNDLVAWIGVSWVAPDLLDLHFLSFSNLLNWKRTRMWLGGLWVCAVWVMWKWRNKVVFEKCSWDFKKIGEEVKCRFWTWLARKGETQQRITFNGWTNTKLAVQWG